MGRGMTLSREINDLVSIIEMLNDDAGGAAQLAQEAYANLDAFVNCSEEEPFTSEDARLNAQECVDQLLVLVQALGGRTP